ncbi:transglutaminase domain-containing protein [Paenibacillus sp. MSJ-34]|uniref:transglutaminase family protein n=1 Tax=Paenibacillus sp. MSJ-34 TaxID=2841529 RepID=UPI001C0FD7A9|nr:transglutaminase domain-containing protein [Paenibacillus sp. MSJ-34]MBU5443265.1 DUF3488 and transglutaminase-like domain-containing protein [Paenibacillus sp. MSJ-34]
MSAPSRFARNALLSLLLFLLFAEWLYPLYRMVEATELYEVKPIFIAIASFLIIGLLPLRWYSALLLHSAVCVAMLLLFFHRDMASWPQGLIQIADTLIQDGRRLIVSFRMERISSEGRTLLLLIGWAMVASSVQSLALSRQRGLFFVAATAVYLVALQWWLGLDTNNGLVRTAAIGLSLLALLRYVKLEQMPVAAFAERSFRHGEAVSGMGAFTRGTTPYSLGQGNGWPVSWIAGSFAVIALFVGIGLSAASQANSGIHPVSWQVEKASFGDWVSRTFGSQAAEWLGAREWAASPGSSVGATGYSKDDSELGARIAPVDTVLFTAESPVPAYWRGESKSVYNGRGWSQPRTHWTGTDWRGTIFGERLADSERQGDTISQKVTLSDEAAKSGMPLLAGGTIERIKRLQYANPSADIPDLVQIDAAAITARMPANARTGDLLQYELEVRMPNVPADRLRLMDGDDPSEIRETYLQLPPELPARVAELAERITAEAGASRIEQVEAIERYLREHYEYSMNDTKVPPKGADFVDHFLFEQQRGYCNHFSTAMVVMLRTQGIPARWVKGFAPGERSGDNANLYTVRARDAHAWVEVYFDGVGWLPFEPTPGFGVQAGEPSGAVTASAPSVVSAPNRTVSAAQDGSHWRSAEWIRSLASTGYASLLQAAEWSRPIWDGGVRASGPIAAIVLAVILTVGIVWFVMSHYRIDWQLKWAMRQYGRTGGDPNRLRRVALLIWARMARQYGDKGPHMTMREYVERLTLEDEREKGRLVRLVYDMEKIAFDFAGCDRATRRRLLDVPRRTSASRRKQTELIQQNLNDIQ